MHVFTPSKAPCIFSEHVVYRSIWLDSGPKTASNVYSAEVFLASRWILIVVSLKESGEEEDEGEDEMLFDSVFYS